MSTRCNVSSLIQIFCFLLLQCRCSSADFVIDCFSSFHLSPTFPSLFLVLKHFVKVLRKSALVESSCRSLISKRLPCFLLCHLIAVWVVSAIFSRHITHTHTGTHTQTHTHTHKHTHTHTHTQRERERETHTHHTLTQTRTHTCTCTCIYHCQN